MKKIIKFTFVITASILLATFLLGLFTLGSAFQFENYSPFGWIIFITWYIFCICIGLICSWGENDN